MEYKKYSGDSLHLNQESPFFWDHVVRYWWANEKVKNLDVLDCATGKGYGAYIMSLSARSVTGIDLNDTSLKVASESFSGQENLVFKRQDIFKLEELGKKFDVITAFEVIEHIDPSKTDEFLSSIKSVLKSDGTLLISTPNHDVVLASGVHVPSFHINNFKSTELKQVLEKHFSNVKMLGQFKKRTGLQQLIFNLDTFNLRHKLFKYFKTKKKNGSHPDESENDHEVIKLQHLNANDFNQRPSKQMELYSFSPKHYRQAGLTVAICKI